MQVHTLVTNQIVVIKSNGDCILFSYGIPVAIKTVEGFAYFRRMEMSKTTRKHVNSWLSNEDSKLLFNDNDFMHLVNRQA